jgi:lipopolysaccharide transport system permease protein
MKSEETVYNCRSLYEKGIINIFASMFLCVYRSRELIYRLFWRNFVSRYKQSLLSWGWIFLMPFITMGTFLALNVSGVLKIGKLDVAYPIYGLLGVSLWNLFSNGLPSITTSLTSAQDIIGKINFPKETLVFASIFQVVIDFLIRMILVLAVFAMYFRLPSIMFLLFPLYLLPLILLVIGIGFLTSILQVIFKDTQYFINLGLSLFLFLMPIMYTFPTKGLLYSFNKYNIVYFLISVPRDLMIFGNTNEMMQFIYSSAFAIVIFIFGWFVFYISETKLAERI